MNMSVFEFQWWGYILAALALTHVTIVSVTIFLHRSQAHAALKLHPILSHFFRFWLWLTTGIVTKEWVAVHRKHHAKVESEDDPHSPAVAGINAVLWGGLILYRHAARLPGILEQYGKGTPDDWLEKRVYAAHPNIGLFLLLALNMVLFGPVPGTAIWAVQMLWIPFWAAGVINGIGHYAGYRNFELPDASRNIVPWGILIGGEELHNNHHAYASSAQFSTRWWEIDIGWFYVKLFSFLRLAKIMRRIPVLKFQGEKHQCDAETVKAFVTNRFVFMSNFIRDVMDDVCREEIRTASGETRKMIKKSRRLLTCDRSKLSSINQERLRTFLASNKKLEMTYTMKENLYQIVMKSSSSYEQLRTALEDWCRTAEQSGIDSLMKYSMRLRGAVVCA